MPQTIISLRNYYGRTVRTADSKFWFACYLYSIDGVSPYPSLLMCTHSIFIFRTTTTKYQKHLEIDIYVYLPCL